MTPYFVSERRIFRGGAGRCDPPLPEIRSHGTYSQISTLPQGEGKPR
jgi:hypothetical protein